MLKFVLALLCVEVIALSVVEAPKFVAPAEVRFYDHRPPGGPIDLAWDTNPL